MHFKYCLQTNGEKVQPQPSNCLGQSFGAKIQTPTSVGPCDPLENSFKTTINQEYLNLLKKGGKKTDFAGPEGEQGPKVDQQLTKARQQYGDHESPGVLHLCSKLYSRKQLELHGRLY